VPPPPLHHQCNYTAIRTDGGRAPLEFQGQAVVVWCLKRSQARRPQAIQGLDAAGEHRGEGHAAISPSWWKRYHQKLQVGCRIGGLLKLARPPRG
jgi:hypothetical protein